MVVGVSDIVLKRDLGALLRLPSGVVCSVFVLSPHVLTYCLRQSAGRELLRKGVVHFSHWKPREPRKPRQPLLRVQRGYSQRDRENTLQPKK